MNNLEGYIALGFTTLLGLAIRTLWKKIATSASQSDFNKLKKELELAQALDRSEREKLWILARANEKLLAEIKGRIEK
jgi:hypothetical protein